MTIDDRLNALAQTVELLAGMQVKTEEKMQQLEEVQRKTEEELRLFVQNVDGGMLQIAKILQNHEGRLDTLEGR